MTTSSTAVADATDTNSITESEAADQFLARFAGSAGDNDDASKKKPSDQGDEDETATDETADDTDESDESPDADGAADGDAEEKTEKAKKYVDDVESFVKIKVGDEEFEVPVKDLTRLHGQEAALTRKSQEVAEHRKTVDAQAAQYVAGLDVLVKRASEKADEFRKINFLALTKDPNVSADELAVLQTEAQRVFDEERFLKSELGNFMTEVNGRQTKERQAQAVETVKTLGTPGTADKPNPHYIEGWSEKTYDDIRSFAVTSGMDADIVRNIVDPAAIKMMHMAMMFKRGVAKVTTVKTDKQPKKIVKTNSAPKAPAADKALTVAKAMKTQKASGNLESTTNAFLARFQTSSDED